jgi:hypothetical protein
MAWMEYHKIISGWDRRLLRYFKDIVVLSQILMIFVLRRQGYSENIILLLIYPFKRMEYCILLYGHMRKRFVATGTYIHN